LARRSSPQKSITLRELFGTAALQQEMVMYVIVSAMDLLMTYNLLSRGQFVEANPVARFFIREWGPKGMVYFKFGMVAVVCVLAQIIAQSKPKAARWLLLGATALVSIVVIYSLMLLLRHGDLPGFDEDLGWSIRQAITTASR
jgi:hypothetical protein